MIVRRVMLAATLVAVTLPVLAACGDDGQDTIGGIPVEDIQETIRARPAQPEPTAGPSPTLAPEDLSGRYEVRITLQTDVSGIDDEDILEALDELAEKIRVEIGADGALTIAASRPFIDVTGTREPDGTFTATGSGLFGDQESVPATFEGTLADGEIEGTYTIELREITLVFSVNGATDFNDD